MPARKIAIFSSRRATPEDSGAIASIYNEGIGDRVATFETRLRSAEDVRAWFDGVHPVVVVERDGDILAFAATFSYRPERVLLGAGQLSRLASAFDQLPPWTNTLLETRQLEEGGKDVQRTCLPASRSNGFAKPD